MSTVPTAQLQPKAYLMPPGMVPVPARRTLNSESSQRLKPNVAVSDLSLVYPEMVVDSSESLGWQNVRALEVLHTTGEWTLPPLENHCIMVQLGPAVDVSACIGSESFTQTLKPGETIIIPAGLPLRWHQLQTMPNRMLLLYLHPDFLRNTAESIDVDHAQISIFPQFGIRDEHIRHVGLSLHCELKQSNLIGPLYADSLAQVLAMQLVRRYSYLRDLQMSHGGMAPRKLRKAIEFINENLDKEQTVASAAVADAVQMSYFHFSRAFKQSTGLSPNVYMTEQRIERAKKLLSETDCPIADIALRTGFASQSHFTTTFRKFVWTTPRAFRGML
ncbi:MAG: AraC family transcriptional regulator [Pyrinomonadaceae bacterium]